MDFITLGIGPGGDVQSFILVGLAPNASAVVEVGASTADVSGSYVVSASVFGASVTSADVSGRYVITRDDVIGSL